MRGKPFPINLTDIIPRITPADAGKTLIRSNTFIWAKDHPRGCGENFIIPLITSLDTGSPPRMRGKQITEFYIASLPRITPADAGKTQDEVTNFLEL